MTGRSTTGNKPFKGVISQWWQDGQVVWGKCLYHTDAKDRIDVEAMLNNHIVRGHEMHTSRVENIKYHETFAICETKNSVYILIEPRFLDAETTPRSVPKTVKVVMIVGPRGRMHWDKVTRTPREAWVLLADELWPRGAAASVRIVEMRRLGYECKPITIAISPAETTERSK